MRDADGLKALASLRQHVLHPERNAVLIPDLGNSRFGMCDFGLPVSLVSVAPSFLGVCGRIPQNHSIVQVFNSSVNELDREWRTGLALGLLP